MTGLKYRAWPVWLALVVMAVAAPARAQTPLGDFQVDARRLDNGLRVISKQRGRTKSVTVELVVDVGLRDYPCRTQALPHVLEHMLFLGSDRHSGKQLRQRIRDKAGTLNGRTLTESSYYYVTLHSDYLSLAIDTLHEMLTRTRLTGAHLAKARGVVRSERATGGGGLRRLLGYRRALLEQARGRLHPHSNLDCRYKSLPENVPLAALKKAYARYYRAANMTLIVVGDFDRAALYRRIDATFGAMPRRSPRAPFMVPRAEVPDKPLIAYNPPTDGKLNLFLTVAGPGYDDGDALLMKLTADYLSDRLYDRVRTEAGIGYTPRAAYRAGAGMGYLVATTQTVPDQAQRARKLFADVYGRVASRGIPAADVGRVKRQMILELESRELNDEMLAAQYRRYRGWIAQHDAMRPLVKTLRALTPAQINRGIKRLLPRRPFFAILEPRPWGQIVLVVLVVVAVPGLGVWAARRWVKRRG